MAADKRPIKLNKGVIAFAGPVEHARPKDAKVGEQATSPPPEEPMVAAVVPLNAGGLYGPAVKTESGSTGLLVLMIISLVITFVAVYLLLVKNGKKKAQGEKWKSGKDMAYMAGESTGMEDHHAGPHDPDEDGWWYGGWGQKWNNTMQTIARPFSGGKDMPLFRPFSGGKDMPLYATKTATDPPTYDARVTEWEKQQQHHMLSTTGTGSGSLSKQESNDDEPRWQPEREEDRWRLRIEIGDGVEMQTSSGDWQLAEIAKIEGDLITIHFSGQEDEQTGKVRGKKLPRGSCFFRLPQDMDSFQGSPRVLEAPYSATSGASQNMAASFTVARTDYSGARHWSHGTGLIITPQKSHTFTHFSHMSYTHARSPCYAYTDKDTLYEREKM